MALPYELGEMKDPSGAALRYALEAKASELAREMNDIISANPLYKQVERYLNPAPNRLYFIKIIKTEIYAAVRDLLVIQWHIKHDKNIRPDKKIVTVPRTGIHLLLAEVWPDKNIKIRYNKENIISVYLNRLKEYWRFNLKNTKRVPERQPKPKRSMLAVQYAEGLDLARRSDMVWFPKSGIDPEQVLIYFDGHAGQKVGNKTIQAIEDLGMKWVCLSRSDIIDQQLPVWKAPFDELNSCNEYLKVRPRGELEKWIKAQGIALLRQVDYWASFYRHFNVKLNLIMGEGQADYLARRLAFGADPSMKGFLAGKQRSDISLSDKVFVGHYPADIYFTWNTGTRQYLTSSPSLTNVTTGYANDLYFENSHKNAERIRRQLKEKGVSYTVGLFDNVHGPRLQFSTQNMNKFYRLFLEWFFEDPNLGIIIKSKKPLVLEGLPEILLLIKEAETTGRLIKLKEEQGRPPVDAAAAADMAVGIGISSAVIESVVAGMRGVHCDLSSLKSHKFYRWGYEKIIFDDLERLISALKKHKNNPADNADLGDWAPFKDELDPFRDGRAGERMGNYLRVLLEAFDQGSSSSEALSRANRYYAEKWGRDKVHQNES